MDKSFFTALGLGLCLLLLAGCASSTSSRYYVLNPLAAESKAQSQESCPTIGVGPIKLPDYVNRPQIVTRTSENEIALAYFDLWAEPLTESVPRMLGENLSRLVCTKEIVFFPWRPSRIPQYRVAVEVLKMDGAPGKTASLEAWWSVAQDKKRLTRRASYSQSAGQGFQGLVEAQSRLLEALSRDIAGALQEIRP